LSRDCRDKELWTSEISTLFQKIYTRIKKFPDEGEMITPERQTELDNEFNDVISCVLAKKIQLPKREMFWRFNSDGVYKETRDPQ
jgi:hypothetical protein